MTALQAAQHLLIQRTSDVYLDMRENVEPDEYSNHFSKMGELITKLESYTSFGAICDAIIKEELGVIGLFGDDEEMQKFLSDVSKLMATYL